MANLFDFAVSTVEIRGIVWQLFLEVKLPKNMKGSSLRSHLGLKFSIFALPGIDGVHRWCLKASGRRGPFLGTFGHRPGQVSSMASLIQRKPSSPWRRRVFPMSGDRYSLSDNFGSPILPNPFDMVSMFQGKNIYKKYMIYI